MLVSRIAPVQLFQTLTFAPGMTAPELSRITPESVAVVVCPKAIEAVEISTTGIRKRAIFVVMVFCLEARVINVQRVEWQRSRWIED